MREAGRTKNVLFLLAVAVLAVVFAADVVSRATVPGKAPHAPAQAGTSGEPRDVDMEALRRLLRQGRLSDREALFADPADDD